MPLPPPSTPLDVVETRLGFLYLALAAADRLNDEAETPLTGVRQRLLQASMHTFRAILREHAATESGHCQSCRFQHPGYCPRLSWPCPTVELIEAALLELHADPEPGADHPSQ